MELLRRKTQSSQYWRESFEITQEDISYLMNLLLEEETPLTTEELALRMVRYRVEQEVANLKEQLSRGKLYQPKDTYENGDHLIFPMMNYREGQVIGSRPGENPNYGPFTVIKVEFENGGKVREFASDFPGAHALNRDSEKDLIEEAALSPEALFAQERDQRLPQLDQQREAQPDLVRFAGRWFVRQLLLEVNVGHLNLAEAVLDMSEGRPLPTDEILPIVDLPAEVPVALRRFSLDYALAQDDRFDEVGPSGEVLWHLHRMTPPGALEKPEILHYKPVEYSRLRLTTEMLDLEFELDDEYSPLDTEEGDLDEATISLIYPHRRAGTLPLSSKLRPFFPKALETDLIRFTFIDGQTEEEMPGWVIPEERYIHGLAEFYREHRLPIGVDIFIRRTDDPSRVIVDYDAYRPRTEWIRLATPGDNKLTFKMSKRSIGARYEDLMVFGVDEVEDLETLSKLLENRRRTLAYLLRDLVTELARLTPQHAVHVKTLYSALTLIRRCPPGPMLAALVENAEFEYVGGHYWRLSGRA